MDFPNQPCTMFDMDASELSRPLFEEPDESLERPDGWSEPKGFLVGGMALPTRSELAQQYYDAGSVLVEAIHCHRWEDYRLVNPVLFLYRHALELLLKDILDDHGKEHDLGRLTERLELLVSERYGQCLPSWITQRLTELAAIDPSSTAFRYAETYNKASKESLPVAGEVHVNLHHLGLVMEALRSALVRLLSENESRTQG